MKGYITIFILIVIHAGLHAQNTIKFDSTKLTQLKKINVDSLVAVSQSKIDSTTELLNSRLDSLNRLTKSTIEYLNSSDSLLSAYQNKLTRNVKHMHDSVKNRLFGKLYALDSIVKAKRTKLDSIKTVMRMDDQLPTGVLGDIPGISDLNNLKIPYKKWDLPSIHTQLKMDNPFSSMKGISLNDNLAKLNLPLKNLNDFKLPDEFKQLQEHFSKIKSFQATALSKEGLANASQKVIETQIGKLNEMGVVQNNLTQASKATEMLKELGDNVKQGPENMKAQAKEEFVDYLKGHEEKVQKDLDDIGKLQLKYRNVADARLLPKRPPNEMKGKPFVERLIPAITLQTYVKDNTGIDIAPTIGYRISGRVRAGFGGFKRVVFKQSNNSLSSTDIYGLRFYNQFRFWKSNYAHLELEHSQGIEPTPYSIDTGGDLINKINFGIYRTYRITKWMNGHWLLLYDLKQISKFPNTSHSSMRFGVDIQLRKRKK